MNMAHSTPHLSILLLVMSIAFVYGNLLGSSARFRRLTPEQKESDMIELWADTVVAFSSQFDATRYTARKAIGPPDVYPKYGNIPGSWSQRVRNSAQFIVVKFSRTVFLQKVDIYETFHAGGVWRLRARKTGSQWHILYQTDTVANIQHSRIFSPPLTIPLNESVNELYIDVDCRADGTAKYVEIDAIKIHGYREMVQLWANNVIDYSSQYYKTERYGAHRALNQPDVDPPYGDNTGAWAQDDGSLNNAQYIEVGFAEALFLRAVGIYETFNAGGVRKLSARMSNDTWQTLFHNDTVQKIASSRIFSPRITTPACPVNALRVEVDCTADGRTGYVEIDAIAIYGLKECSQGKWGQCCGQKCGKCWENTQCNKSTGNCPKIGASYRCAAGYKGDMCDRVYFVPDCISGKYGQGCRDDCGHCANGPRVCMPTTGECPGSPTCLPGYMGKLCKTGCISGKYGQGCRYDCGHCANGPWVCTPTTGECPGSPTCLPGYKGKLCKTECISGKYGQGCRDDCGHCANGPRVCTTTTGECPGSPTCLPGYKGKLCKTECISGKYGQGCRDDCGHCANGPMVCTPTTGECIGSPACLPGYKGIPCKTECEEGEYGSDCTGVCGQCAGGPSKCSSTSGLCSDGCVTGYKGDLCQTKCDEGKYGSDCTGVCGQCAGGLSKCSSTSGLCSDGCLAGYKGDLCQTNCSSGEYGANCTEVCGHCVNGPPACSTTSGECSGSPACLPGYKGTHCKTNCSSGEYGMDCKEICGHCASGVETCSPNTGICAGSPPCLPGYTGELCQTEAAPQSVEPGPGAAIGGAAGGLLVLAVAGAVLVFFIKRRRNSSKEFRGQTKALNAGVQEDRDVPHGPGRRGSDTEYYNVITFQEGAFAIPVDELETHVRAKRVSDGISSEYGNLPKGLRANTKVAMKPENKGKSRYQNIVAYDHSRVVLDLLDDDPNSDYINACYIHGYKEQNKYVASQGPTPLIIKDFWRTIWQVDTGKVVMLTNLVEDTKTKSERYWPTSVSETAEFGKIRVTLVAEDVFVDLTVRVLHVTNKKNTELTKEITQFHFTSWPDHGVPIQATGLLNFLEKVNAKQTHLGGPLFVHCSAGIGRTGTFIGLDYLIKQATEDGVVDVPACVRLMRQQRTNMIQTEGQYNFLYDALIEALQLSDRTVPSTAFPTLYREICTADPDTGQTKLQKQFDVLEEMSPGLKTTDSKASLDPANKHKNRSMTILAADSARPFLSTPVAGANDYINAVFIPAYKRKRAFIITQAPLPGTVIDFWRLIHEQDVRTVIMLNIMDKARKDSGIYWPENSGQFGPFDVETLETEDGDFYQTRILQLKYKKRIPKEQVNIKQFQCAFWSDGEIVPGSCSPLVTLIEEVERWQQKSGNGPIVVHCLDGATKSGLYCAVSSIIERLKVDQEVNILQTLKQMKMNRPDIVRNLDQFQFIHDVVLAYLNNFQIYANLQ